MHGSPVRRAGLAPARTLATIVVAVVLLAVVLGRTVAGVLKGTLFVPE